MPKDAKFNAEGPNSQQAFGDIVNNITNNYIQKKLPSYLSKVIFYLEKILDEPIEHKITPQIVYDLNNKIFFNNVIKYKQTIQDYSNYGGTIDRILEELDNTKPNSKKRFLENIRRKYILTLGEVKNFYQDDIGLERLLKENSDEIIDAVFDKLKKSYLESIIDSEIMLEDLENCLIIIICKAFIDCKILEQPT